MTISTSSFIITCKGSSFKTVLVKVSNKKIFLAKIKTKNLSYKEETCNKLESAKTDKFILFIHNPS